MKTISFTDMCIHTFIYVSEFMIGDIKNSVDSLQTVQWLIIWVYVDDFLELFQAKSTKTIRPYVMHICSKKVISSNAFMLSITVTSHKEVVLESGLPYLGKHSVGNGQVGQGRISKCIWLRLASIVLTEEALCHLSACKERCRFCSFTPERPV